MSTLLSPYYIFLLFVNIITNKIIIVHTFLFNFFIPTQLFFIVNKFFYKKRKPDKTSSLKIYLIGNYATLFSCCAITCYIWKKFWNNCACEQFEEQDKSDCNCNTNNNVDKSFLCFFTFFC